MKYGMNIGKFDKLTCLKKMKIMEIREGGDRGKTTR